MNALGRLTWLATVLAVFWFGAPAWAVDYYFEHAGTNDWWMTTDNWKQFDGSPATVPNSQDAVVIFDGSRQTVGPPFSTNVHNLFYTVQETRFNADSNWRIHNSRQDVWLNHPTSNALVTQNGTGSITFDCDLRFDDDTIFGGTGSGRIDVIGSGSIASATEIRRYGTYGVGGLTKNGSYALALNNVASYQGATVVNAGSLLFNADSAEVNTAWVPGNTDYYVDATLAPVTVNSGGTLGGTGILRAPVTVNSGGNFAPGESAGVFTIDDNLTLAAGSNTLVELGGTSPGNGTGYHDQTIVSGQLSLGGTLDLSGVGGFEPIGRFNIFQYGSLDPSANAFDTVNLPGPSGYRFELDYGTGTNSAITFSGAAVYYYTGNHATLDYWEFPDNWDQGVEPGSVAARGDIVIFDEGYSSRNVTNIWNNDRYVREVEFNTTGTWQLHHNHFTLHLHNPDSGIASRFTQNNSGAIRLNCDTSLDTDTVFGGSGTGDVTIYGRVVESADYGLRRGLFGPGGLTKQGDYTLTLENYASYQGPTAINEGTLLFNAESAEQNPGFDPGDTNTWFWVPTTMGQVTVNSGGTLGGTGILRAPVTVNAGGNFAPGVSPGIFTVDSLALAAGSNTLIELGGLTPGNGSGHHDQAIVTGQLGLGGTLDISLYGGHAPTEGDSYTIFQYGSLDPSADAFDTVVTPALPGLPANYKFVADYGSGSNDDVTLTLTALPHYYTRGHATYDYWGLADNWSHGMVPGRNSAEGDVVVFALTGQSSYSVNTHDGSPFSVKELRIEGTSNWTFYNPVRDIQLSNPEAGQNALFTHDGSGTVTLDCDLVLGSDTIIGGSGSGTITVNGSPFHATYGPALGTTGTGGLTLDGDFTLVLNNVANNAGPTVINSGKLLFNGESAEINPAWTTDPGTWYLPAAMNSVTVADGGTLGGIGMLWAEVTVQDGGTLAPGQSQGIFTLGGLTLETGSETQFEIGGLLPGEGSGFHDQIIVGDPLGLGLSGELSLAGTLIVEAVDGFEPVLGDTIVLFQYDSLDPANNSFDQVIMPTGLGWDKLMVNYGSGTNSQVILSAVPEPASSLLLIFGVALLLWRRRR